MTALLISILKAADTTAEWMWRGFGFAVGFFTATILLIWLYLPVKHMARAVFPWRV